LCVGGLGEVIYVWVVRVRQGTADNGGGFNRPANNRNS
jgi:hypothetical protein